MLEYVVNFANGRIAVEVIGSDDPRLREYYRYLTKEIDLILDHDFIFDDFNFDPV